MTAWLLTWEQAPMTERPARERIAAILNPRWSGERVRGIVEVLHHSKCYSLRDLTQYANNYASNPYPAEFTRIDGVACVDQVICGHNPWLFARKVDKLVIKGQLLQEDVTWIERPAPKFPKWLSSSQHSR